jgi:hypothetical protein
MRAHQLSATTATAIDRITNIVLIPIRCTCAARPDDDQFTVADVRINVGGMPVRDAVITSVTNSGDHIRVSFIGTAIFYTTGGIGDALDEFYRAPVEIWTGDVVGIAHEGEMDVGTVVTLVRSDGQVFQLIDSEGVKRPC